MKMETHEQSLETIKSICELIFTYSEGVTTLKIDQTSDDSSVSFLFNGTGVPKEIITERLPRVTISSYQMSQNQNYLNVRMKKKISDSGFPSESIWDELSKILEGMDNAPVLEHVSIGLKCQLPQNNAL